MVIIYNPTAGNRRVHRLWRVLDILAANGVRIEVLRTERAGDAQRLARAAAEGGARLVVAAGGDGTIAEVANGLLGTPATLGVIPLGTANVLAHEYALPFAPRAVAAALAFGRTRLLWPGLAEGGGPLTLPAASVPTPSTPTPSTPAPSIPAAAAAAPTRLFVQMLGVGFDADVVRRLPLGLKKVLGRGAYVWQTLRELARYEFPPVTLRLDGVEVEAVSAIVTKGRLYGGRYLLAPEADSGARGFSVVLFEQAGWRAALRGAIALPLGRLGAIAGVRRVRAREIEFLGDPPMAAQTDGDPAGRAPRLVRDAARPIALVVSG